MTFTNKHAPKRRRSSQCYTYGPNYPHSLEYYAQYAEQLIGEIVSLQREINALQQRCYEWGELYNTVKNELKQYKRRERALKIEWKLRASLGRFAEVLKEVNTSTKKQPKRKTKKK